MYEVLDKTPVYLRGKRYFPGDTFDTADENVSELVSKGIVRKVEVPSAELPPEPAPSVEETSLFAPAKPPVEAPPEKTKPVVKKSPASRKVSD
jgi:hypothetical protein